MAASVNGHVEIVQILIKHDANVNQAKKVKICVFVFVFVYICVCARVSMMCSQM